jgi:hypothetical protein
MSQVMVALMRTRWTLRAISAVAGMMVLSFASFGALKWFHKNPERERFKEGIQAAAALRHDLGRDCDVHIELKPGSDEDVVVTVRYPNAPTDLPVQRELIRSTNIIARRWVHHVQDLKVVFDGQ